jgi:hypothetical protein
MIARSKLIVSWRNDLIISPEIQLVAIAHSSPCKFMPRASVQKILLILSRKTDALVSVALLLLFSNALVLVVVTFFSKFEQLLPIILNNTLFLHTDW